MKLGGILSRTSEYITRRDSGATGDLVLQMNERGNERQPRGGGQASEASAVTAPISGLTFGAADGSALRARDELRQVTQSEIDRVIAAYEAWLGDVQTTFPNRIGPKVLSYAIQQTLRAWELSAPPQAGTDVRPAPKPSQLNALMFPAFPIAEPKTPAVPGELKAEAMPLDPNAADALAGADASSVLQGELQGADEAEPDFDTCDGDVDPSEVLDGTVDLSISASSAVGQIPSFLTELRRRYDLRLLQMRSDRSNGTTLITLGLRKPLPLKRVLLRMISVSEVAESPPDDAASEEPAFLHVRLNA